MKRLLLALTLLLALAGAASASTTAPPQSPAEGPDLPLMALALADFPASKVDVQKYIPVTTGIVASYQRDLVLASGSIALVSDEVDLYTKATKAQNDAVGLKGLLSTAAGRKAFGRAFANGLKPLKTKSIAVSRPASIPAGELAYRFTITALTNRGTVRVGFVIMRLHRAVGFMLVLARKGAKLSAGSLVSLARAQETHFRGGFTIGTVAAPSIAGAAAQGQTLTADRGRWSGGPEQVALQWKRCDAAGANCADIPGATTATYAVTQADAGFTLGVRAQATNPLSTLTSESALTPPVA